MADKKQIAIKERILKQAMEFWGVSDIRDMDPVIDLPVSYTHLIMP